MEATQQKSRNINIARRDYTKASLPSLPSSDHSRGFASTQSVPLVTRKMSLTSPSYSWWLKRSLNLRSKPLTILASVNRASSCAKACPHFSARLGSEAAKVAHLSGAEVRP